MRAKIAAAALLAAFLIIGAFACASVHAGDTMPEPLHLEPPPRENGQPVDVSVALHVINLSRIDEVQQEFQIDAYLFERWHDSRLAYVQTPGDRRRHYKPGDLWTPQLEIINAAVPRDRYDTSLSVTPDGTVEYVERFAATLSSKFELRRFPFDGQRLNVIYHPFVGQGSNVHLVIDDEDTWTASEFESYSSLAQWQVSALKPILSSARVSKSITVPEVQFQISVTRKYAFYIWKVFLPLILMVCLSWAVFWIEARDLNDQIQVAVTTILTVIAFAFAISSNMPRVSYLTFIDAFFLDCYIFVFIAVVELMIVHVTHRSERRADLGSQLRRISRFAVPAAFVASVAILAIRFLG